MGPSGDSLCNASLEKELESTREILQEEKPLRHRESTETAGDTTNVSARTMHTLSICSHRPAAITTLTPATDSTPSNVRCVPSTVYAWLLF